MSDLKFGEIPQCWQLFDAALTYSTAPIVLWGPAGIGKTYGILAAARQHAVPCYKLQLTEETSADEPRGRFTPRPVEGPNGSIGTVLDWQDGPLLQALRGGGWVLWDDLHRIGPDVTGLLYLAAESRESLSFVLPTGERVHAPPKNYRCLATSNVDPTEQLDEALLSRFVLRVHINAPHPSALGCYPETWRGGIAESVSCTDATRRTTLREWMTFSEIVAGTGQMDLSATLVWGARGKDIVAALKIGTAAA